MHKYTDIPVTGGLQFDWELYAWDRAGLYESLKAVLGDCGNTPTIVSGELDAFTNAWLMINGELVPFVPPGVGLAVSPGYAAYVVVSESGTDAELEDGGTVNVLNKLKVAGFQILEIATAPPTAIPPANFVKFHKIFGDVGRNSLWVNTSVTAAQYDAEIFYRKNMLTNTLQLKGSVTVKNVGFLSTSNYYYAIFTGIAAQYRPVTTVPFPAFFRYHGTSLKDHSGSDFISQLNGEWRADGSLAMGLRKPDTSVTSYIVTFNCIIPLD